MLSPAEILFVATIAAFAALAAVYWLGRAQRNHTPPDVFVEEPLAMLFDDGILHHATATALRRFALMPGAHLWDDLRDTLRDRFPDFPDHPATGEAGRVTLRADENDDLHEVEISWRGSLCWVTCIDRRPPGGAVTDHGTAALRRAVESTPHACWQTNRRGQVTWHNAAYESLFKDIHRRKPRRDDHLFDPKEGSDNRRVALTGAGRAASAWFDVTAQEYDDVIIHHATSIDALVEAEEAQRRFVQTLAKTFAHLPIGLAIFNRDEQLVLFNPALLDLSGLPAEFLSARPNLLSFFDQLRENRRMPEPKNYENWRQEIAELVLAAADGRYHETWSLEDGRTYSVQGRPHPDGATVFLFEDISAEVSLTRNFRAELELTQHLLDRVEDCIAVFSPSGTLTYCNSAYRALWHQNPDTAFADISIADCVALWRRGATTDLTWSNLLNLPDAGRHRSSEAGTITMTDGQRLSCVSEPIASGATMVKFRRLDKVCAPTT
ncbi:Sensor protein DivL [Sulfitobacter sp. THAF37]|uniref:PAS-domain containing protein n=1 Tax=Sulfitobacter sp. THAF37 TaxID=2587855 RepID=UPI001268FF35|nr:PAS-domain containing protein [Sulfitobacter sp. THAF37]QFT58286.1 Sensor protein DivL [Sulfitobacter sp. THAF37]